MDNARVRNGSSDNIAALSDLSIVIVRPSMLDLLVGMDRVSWLNASGSAFVVVIGAAPALRQGIGAPFVRDARRSLSCEAKRLWRSQITLRHAIIESVDIGTTLTETEPGELAAGEFCVCGAP